MIFVQTRVYEIPAIDATSSRLYICDDPKFMLQESTFKSYVSYPADATASLMAELIKQDVIFNLETAIEEEIRKLVKDRSVSVSPDYEKERIDSRGVITMDELRRYPQCTAVYDFIIEIDRSSS